MPAIERDGVTAVRSFAVTRYRKVAGKILIPGFSRSALPEGKRNGFLRSNP
ncbi:hypothetical protein [Oxalobacter paraformigenes]|uniref:hypothetical protein n=1 Tax=Oxalobacter paraformigenes TaxID=556268 RepID=UPI00031D3671|nr:hypothetical protein [Oxalobacter paraformigenes]